MVPGVLVRTGGTEANVTGGEFTGTRERQRDRLGSSTGLPLRGQISAPEGPRVITALNQSPQQADVSYAVSLAEHKGNQINAETPAIRPCLPWRLPPLAVCSARSARSR